MKRLLLIVFVVLCLSISLVACDSIHTSDIFGEIVGNDAQNVSPYKELYDENGVFLEDNYVYNMALEKENGITVIKDNVSEYKIVYEKDTTDDNVLHAIEELKLYFKNTANEIEAIDDGHAEQEKEIVVGNTNREIGAEIEFEKVGAYAVKTVGQKIFIYGDNTYSITNGVYGFMEDYLGCMFFDGETTYYPPLTTLILAPIDEINEPAFTRRDVGDNQTWNVKYFDDKMRVRASEEFDPNGCHTSLYLLSDEVRAAHPEYYAEIDGQRRTTNYGIGDQGPQLCFSNPDVIDLLEEATVNRANNYNGTVEMWWDISQQDSMNYCHCSECTKIAEKLNNPAGALYECINTIAKRHPEIKISTLAYHYGSTPPVNIEFADNVMIKWCIMSEYGRNDYSKPLSESESKIGQKQYQEILGWSELVDNIYVWDYITNYFYYLVPFPCLTAMSENIKLLRDCNVDGVLSLSVYNNRGSADRLKANYASHLLWNPDMDAERFINKFITLYYGKEAAPYIINMYARMEETVDDPLCVYNFPSDHKRDYLSEANINYYFECIDNAVEASGEDEVIQERLRFERLTILYGALYLKYGGKNVVAERLVQFEELCEEFGITGLNEIRSTDVASFAQRIRNEMGIK